MNRELLMLVDAISREKSVDLEVVFGAVEAALASATKKLHGGEVDIRVVGRPRHRRLRDLPPLARRAGRGRPAAARLRRSCCSRRMEQIPDIEVDDYIEEPVESVPIGRIGAQAAKQVILQKIRDAEREQLLNDFLSRGDKIFVGTVKRLDKGDIIVESGRIEGRLRRSEMIPKENLRTGDRVRAYHRRGRPDAARRRRSSCRARAPGLHDRAVRARKCPRSSRACSRSRAAPATPARAPRSPCVSHDKRVDPIGTCVGVRGSRVNAVTNELAGERVDIVLWSRRPGAVRDRRAGAGQRAVDRRRRGEARDGRRGRRGKPRDRDRPRRPERAPRLRADRLAHQHHDGRGIGVEAGRGDRTRCASSSSRSSTSTRRSPTS